ncbi:MAG: ABC transporter ATP-binding protein [Deltaproteobacteria bacterium]|nr:ABC transporter ATP-binding protein [Deltaproteobacteria bacterium]MBW2668346.1 ABC transporter ATP-binding protein [Deltaproteobacteria bacterium]MBW2710482.1 ABC transporter ATP-binding protein [Deltaproteobacteria bacterium]
MTVLQLQKLSKTFNGICALSGIDFTINEGEIVGLVGPNGAGKTTLFNLISGRLRPSSGKILFEDKDITGFKPHAVCRLGISRTFQSSRPFSRMSTLHNVLAGQVFGKGFSFYARPEDEQMAHELLVVVGIAHKADALAADLTLSEQRRLDLARALATRPKLLLLDEVAAGFSPVLVKQAIKLINRVRERGVTLLIIDHFLNLSLKVADRLLVLDHGEKIAEGPPNIVMKNREVLRAYLGMRYQDEEDD